MEPSTAGEPAVCRELSDLDLEAVAGGWDKSNDDDKKDDDPPKRKSLASNRRGGWEPGVTGGIGDVDTSTSTYRSPPIPRIPLRSLPSIMGSLGS